jgi:hypothetical protein
MFHQAFNGFKSGDGGCAEAAANSLGNYRALEGFASQTPKPLTQPPTYRPIGTLKIYEFFKLFRKSPKVLLVGMLPQKAPNRMSVF